MRHGWRISRWVCLEDLVGGDCPRGTGWWVRFQSPRVSRRPDLKWILSGTKYRSLLRGMLTVSVAWVLTKAATPSNLRCPPHSRACWKIQESIFHSKTINEGTQHSYQARCARSGSPPRTLCKCDQKHTHCQLYPRVAEDRVEVQT